MKGKYLLPLFVFLLVVPIISYAKITKVQQVTVKNVTQDSAKVTWTKNTSASFYKMRLETVDGTKLNVWKQIQKNKKKISSSSDLLEPGQSYKVKVRACKTSTDCGKWSAYAEFTTTQPANETHINTMCSSDTYNCSNFNTHAEAQSMFDYCMSKGYGDIHRLDYDNNGLACESLR